MTDPTSEALTEHLLQLYEESGFGEIIPTDELRAGFDDTLADAAAHLGESIRAARKGIPLANAVIDTENYPHLSRVHGYATGLLSPAAPSDQLCLGMPSVREARLARQSATPSARQASTTTAP